MAVSAALGKIPEIPQQKRFTGFFFSLYRATSNLNTKRDEERNLRGLKLSCCIFKSYGDSLRQVCGISSVCV